MNQSYFRCSLLWENSISFVFLTSVNSFKMIVSHRHPFLNIKNLLSLPINTNIFKFIIFYHLNPLFSDNLKYQQQFDYHLDISTSFIHVYNCNKIIFLFMNRFNASLIRFMLMKPRTAFCVDLSPTKKLLSTQLYSIDLINKIVNRHILAMAYSPGVGSVCEQIQENPQITNTHTLRGRSVAIVTDGSILDTSATGIKPVMDWFVAQIKYYSSYDPYPFVIEKGTNINEVVKDLASSYKVILFLDQIKDKIEVPEDTIIVKHQQVVSEAKCELTDAEKTSQVISFILENKIVGIASKQNIKAGIGHECQNQTTIPTYDILMKDGRNLYEHALQLHQFYKGKIHVELGFRNINKLKPFFTEKILRRLVNEKDVYSKTSELATIITDGTAVLGYGNIGPQAGLPVMEGKSLLFRLLGNVEVVPVCMYQRNSPQELTKAIFKLLSNFSAINIEDIKAPQCFTVEESLQKYEKLPIFHDDQHGTAIVTLAGLINAAKVVQKNLSNCSVVINGAGAAGITIAKLLQEYGVKDIIICDSQGAIYKGRQHGMNDFKEKLAETTNFTCKKGSLKDVIGGTDIFVGVSVEGALRGHWISTMNKKSIIFALANPHPEIMPQDAKAAGAAVYGSGRSDLQNQINNSLVFPGIFRAIKQHKLTKITTEMKIKAAQAISSCLLGPPQKNYIIPDSLDKDVSLKISEALDPKNFQK